MPPQKKAKSSSNKQEFAIIISSDDEQETPKRITRSQSKLSSSTIKLKEEVQETTPVVKKKKIKVKNTKVSSQSNTKLKRKKEIEKLSEEIEAEKPKKKKKTMKSNGKEFNDQFRIIGRREMIHFPQFGVSNLLAKVDSGAKTSCLDVSNIIHNKTANTISFDVVLDRNDRTIVQTITDFPFSNATKAVMSSNGHTSTRYVVKTVVSMGPEFKDQIAEFTLVERHKLACPALIGRNVIRMGGFLVDCNKTFITGKKKQTIIEEPKY